MTDLTNERECKQWARSWSSAEGPRALRMLARALVLLEGFMRDRGPSGTTRAGLTHCRDIVSRELRRWLRANPGWKDDGTRRVWRKGDVEIRV